jgi:DNA-binding transcriptional LysR family regulator
MTSASIGFNANNRLWLSRLEINSHTPVELRHLKTFVAVAEEGSFTRASARLHVVQSAVSAGVRALERDLGVTLFDRSTHQVRLSDPGRVLLPEARRTLAAAAAAREAVDQVKGGLRGTVVLGTMQAQAMHGFNVPGLLAEFRGQHPDVTIKVRHAGGSSAMADEVREGRLDLAFVALPDRRRPGVRLAPLTREAIALVVPSAHPLAKRAGIDLSDLREEPMVDLPGGWGTRMAIDRAFAAAGVPRTVDYEVNDTASMIDFIEHGLAIGLLPPSFVAGVDDITVVPIRHHVPQFEVAIATPSNRRLSAAAQALVDRIEQQAASRPKR